MEFIASASCRDDWQQKGLKGRANFVKIQELLHQRVREPQMHIINEWSYFSFWSIAPECSIVLFYPTWACHQTLEALSGNACRSHATRSTATSMSHATLCHGMSYCMLLSEPAVTLRYPSVIAANVVDPKRTTIQVLRRRCASRSGHVQG